MSEPLLLGIDVGTTRAKVGAFRLDGRAAALNTASYANGLRVEGEAAEQDPLEWWAAVCSALQTTLSQVDPKALLAVCVGGQGPTMVVMDEELNAVAPALTWMDRRAAGYAQELGTRAKRFVPSHSFLAKAMWFEHERNAAYERTRWFGQAWDYIAAQLVGEAQVSMSPGVAPWDAELLSVCGLDAAKFPEMRRMGTIVGSVSAEAARQTGLPSGLTVVGGITDYFEGILGSGAVCRGIACDSGGTSEIFNVCWDARLDVQGIFCMPSFEPEHWYIGGPTSTSGRALEWWRGAIVEAKANDWSVVDAAGDIAAGSERLIFLPYLAGERAPLWNAEARGVFFGLSLNHTRAHMTRAILEGVGYSVRHLLEQIERAGATVDEIHCCGGQAASELWCQIKADVTGRRVILPEVIEAPVLGAAIIAGVGVGALPDFTQGAQQMMRTRRVLAPDAERHATYSEMYALYRELYASVQPLYEPIEPRMIDAFAHFYPPEFMDRLLNLGVPLPVFVERVPAYVDGDARVAELDRNEIELQAVSLGTPAFDDLFDASKLKAACELARIGNDGIAELVARFPKRFIGVATLPLLTVETLGEALEELERTVKTRGCKGVQIYARAGGTGVDDAAFDALWARVVEYDIPVLLHPTGGWENALAHDYLLWLTFGWPYETSLLMTRLVYGGVFERFPTLKILTHHLGAFIPFMAERIKGVNFTLERTGGTARAEPVLNTLKRFYGDTAVNGFLPALKAGYEFFGADHILFGTDFPYVPIMSQRRAVLDWDLAAADKEKILDGNARKFFKL